MEQPSGLDEWTRLRRLLIQELEWNLRTLTGSYVAKLGELRESGALVQDPKNLSNELEVRITEIGRYASLKDEVIAYCFNQGFFSPYLSVFDDQTKQMMLKLLEKIRIRNGVLAAIQSSPELHRLVNIEHGGERHELKVTYLGLMPLFNADIKRIIQELLKRFKEKPPEKEFG